MTVRVDHSHYADSRWYTGSGIYRDVKMIVTDRLHIPVWGTFVTTPVVTDKYAKVNNQITVRNSYSEPRTAVVEIVYKDNKGNIAAFEVFSIKLNAGEEKIIDIVSEINSRICGASRYQSSIQPRPVLRMAMKSFLKTLSGSVYEHSTLMQTKVSSLTEKI